MMSRQTLKNNLTSLLGGILISLFTHCVFAELPIKDLGNAGFPQILRLEEAFQVTASHTDSSIELAWHIAPQCYLYRESIKVLLILKPTEPLSLLNESLLPAGKKIRDPNFGEQIVYEESFVLPIEFRHILPKLTQAAYTIKIDYQGCASSGFCYPPVSRAFELRVHSGHIQSITPILKSPSTEKLCETPASDTTPTSEDPSFLAKILTFYFIGVLLTFTPCVLPMIPILFVVIVGQAHLNTRRAFGLSLCYVLSMATTYAIAGIIVATLGKNLQASLQKPVVIVLFSALFTYLGLMQLGIGKISLPRKWRDWLHQSHAKQSGGSYLSAAVMGVLATLIASPCVSAPMMGALGYISQSGHIVLGGAALFAMGLGMGTLLIVIGTLEGKYLPKKGPWMHSVNQIFAIILFGLSIWLMGRLLPGSITLALWGLLLLLAATWMGTFSSAPNRIGRLGALLAVYAGLLFWGSWHGSEEPLKPLSTNPWHLVSSNLHLKSHFPIIHSVDMLQTQQALAQKKGRPLIVIFHADWCSICKQFEHDVLADQAIQKQLSHWDTVVADVTSNSPAEEALLRQFDLVGPPVVLFFDTHGNELVKYRIIGGTSRQKFAQRLRQIEDDR